MTPIPQQKILTWIDDHHRHHSTINQEKKKKISSHERDTQSQSANLD